MARKLSFSWWETILWILKHRRRFVVSGESMMPTLSPDQYVLVDVNPPSIQEEDVVVCMHPETELRMIKRVVMIEHGRFFVQGDNQEESTDSRHFGWLTKEHILGLVVSILA